MGNALIHSQDIIDDIQGWLKSLFKSFDQQVFIFGGVGDPKAIPWTNVTPLKAAADAWCHLDVRKGDIVAWPTNLGWMMGPWLVYASLMNGASMALYNGSPLGTGFAKFIQV